MRASRVSALEGSDIVGSSHAVLENNVEELGIGGLRTNFPCARDLFWDADLFQGRKERGSGQPDKTENHEHSKKAGARGGLEERFMLGFAAASHS